MNPTVHEWSVDVPRFRLDFLDFNNKFKNIIIINTIIIKNNICI